MIKFPQKTRAILVGFCALAAICAFSATVVGVYKQNPKIISFGSLGLSCAGVCLSGVGLGISVAGLISQRRSKRQRE